MFLLCSSINIIYEQVWSNTKSRWRETSKHKIQIIALIHEQQGKIKRLYQIVSKYNVSEKILIRN